MKVLFMKVCSMKKVYEKNFTKKKFSVYVRNAQSGPACYYRMIQYVEELDKGNTGVIHNAWTKKEFDANLNCPDGRRKKLLQGILYMRIVRRRFWSLLADLFVYHPRVIVIQREVVPHILPPFFGMLLRLAGKRADIIWDFDDDIFESGEISAAEKKILLKQSRKIVVVNDYLKQLLPVEVQKKTIVLPTSEKCFLNESFSKMLKRRRETYLHEVNLIWVGTGGNLKYLDLVIKELDAAAGRIEADCDKQVKLLVVCNRGYHARYRLRYLKVVNIAWSRERAQACMKAAHIAIMPLEDTRFAKGKGGFKLVQCMASGMPVIASDVGYNKSIVDDAAGYLTSNDSSGGWERAVVELAGDVECWEKCCWGAYEVYREKFYFMDYLEVWRRLLMGGLERN